ncbi:sensor histidine kinase [Dyadobacter sp. 3J3]|uniref:sensor histidine kinase n=1 Tax=Dyadobacter sp. 3J3 TaxID=2606600 RepID=UPI0013577471|nr:histidine kinase [Dyadobacter sp. 3J3]
MDFLRNNYSKTAAVHVAFWLVFIFYSGLDDGYYHHDNWSFGLDPDDICDILIAMFVVYVNLYILIPFFYAKQKHFLYFTALLLVLIAGGLISRFLWWHIWLPMGPITYRHSGDGTHYWIWVRIISDASSYFPVLAVTVLIKMMVDANAREKKLRETEKEKFIAEMSLLKAQINPHFLFNTLNSLYSLTLARSEKSAEMVLRLSDLMRYMLYEASANTVSLTDEIAYLENYISIEQMRFADRLDLSFQYSGDTSGKSISPLLLLPFIENAFKHGIQESSGWITIDLRLDSNFLTLKVENSYSLPVKEKETGLGLANVKKRIELAYPGQYELSITQKANIYSVDLKLQF